MNIYFIQVIKRKINNIEYKNQDQAIEDIERVRNFIIQLNKSSIATGLFILITGLQATNCIISFLDKGNTFFQEISLFFRLIHWLFLTLFPFYQAALANTVLLKLFGTGLSMYRKPVVFNDNQPFQNEMIKMYASKIIVKAKLFGITICPWFPYVIMILILLTLMVGSRIKWYENFL